MKILLLQLKRIGDLILTTPAVRCLRDAFPQAGLTLVIDSSCTGLASMIDVDDCWVYRKGAGLRGLAGFGPNAWMRREILAARPDWTLDFTGTDRSSFLAALSRASRRATFARFAQKPLRRGIFTDFVESSVQQRHTADHYCDLLRPLGIERETVPLDLDLSESDLAEARRLRERGSFAVVHPGTARPEKYWPAERWAEVIRELRNRHSLDVVLTGSNDPSELRHLSEIEALVSGQTINLAGKTSLAGLAGIIREASLFCGVDTAAMHLADAMRTPTLALFGPTNPFHWRPRHTRSVVVRAGTAEPFRPGQAGAPMAQIEASQAVGALGSLLSGN